MHLLIFGSSITWGAWDKEGGWAERIKDFADRKAATLDYDNYTSVYCLGVSGDNTDDLLERFDTEVKARLGEGEKTLILIEIGINDSQYILAEKEHRVSPDKYKQNLVKLIEKSKHHGSNLIFIGLTPVDDNKVDPIPWKPESSYRLEYVQKYEEILKSVCEEQNLLFVELLNKFTEKDFKTLLTDGLHPNTEGHQVMYEEVKKYLVERNLL